MSSDTAMRPESLRRLGLAVAAVVLALVTVLLLDSLLPDGIWARFLLDKRDGGTHPWSVQNAMWIVFFLGLGELVNRHFSASAEMAEMKKGYLPERADQSIIRADLPNIYRSVRENSEKYFLPRLLRRVTQQIQVSESVDRAYSVLATNLDLFMHEIELRYSTLRYIVWFIPTLGFLGTAQGIGEAMNFAGDPENAKRDTLLMEVTQRMGLAFYTTLLALLMAGVVMFLLHVIQSREERALNKAGAYCVDNFINRYYAKSAGGPS